MHQHPGRFALKFHRQKEMTMNRITVPALAPRNPLVAPSRRRLAGAHRRTAGGQRQQQRQCLNRELRELDRQRHSP